MCVCLSRAVALYPKHKADYWAKVARLVGTRSAEECYKRHAFQGTSHSPLTKVKKREKKRLEAPTGPGREKSHPAPSAPLIIQIQRSDAL